MKAGRKGFTLIEVMVAVTILAFAATAAIKLVIMAQNGLYAAQKEREMLEQARVIQIGVRCGKLEKSGTSGDLAWDTAEKEREMMGADFGLLNFGASGDQSASGDAAVKWRELTVRNSKTDEKIVLLLPSAQEKKENKQTVSDDLNTVSGDNKNNSDSNKNNSK